MQLGESETRLRKLATASRQIKDETKAQAALISAASLDEKSGKMLKGILRNRLSEKIGELVKEIEQKIQREEEEIQTYPHLYGGKEVWVVFFQAENPGGRKLVGCAATMMRSDGGPVIAATLEKRDPSLRYLRPSRFRDLTRNLTREVLSGRYDEELGTSAVELVYDRIIGCPSQRGSGCPRAIYSSSRYEPC